MKGTSRILLAIVIGLLVLVRVIYLFYHEFIFDKEVNMIIALVALCSYIWIISKDRKQHSITPNQKSLTASKVIFALTTITLCSFAWLYVRANKPSRIYCVSKMNDFNGVSISFRKDNTYKIINWCMGANFYYGTYTISDSIITIDKSKIENAIVSNRFLIKTDYYTGDSNKVEQSVYQIGQDNQPIFNATEFHILD